MRTLVDNPDELEHKIQMNNLAPLISIILITIALTEADVPKPTVTRTELRVAKSINPDETQTLNVMTKNGNVAQLIVKKRDPKAQLTLSRNENDNQFKNLHTRSLFSNWLPESSVFLPNLIRVDSFAYDTNASDGSKTKSILGKSSNDRLLQIPKPVTIRSGDIFLKPNKDKKKGRSILEIDYDGIPIVHGVRVPDDESDKKVWRNARVINGELIPYENGYKPPVAVPVGQLVYASKMNQDSEQYHGIGPFTTSDNHNVFNRNELPFGPFTVKDNILEHSGGRGKSVGPFTVADNTNTETRLKLTDFIREINAQESKRDYSKRQLRSYGVESAPQIQRRMLQYEGTPSYTNSLVYDSSNTQSGHVNFNEGVRTPILQYAHPELGVQPAKASSEREFSYDNEKDTHVQPSYYTNSINNIDYYKRDVMNYPYSGYYIKPQIEQPFWIKITESIKNNVQNGFQRMHQLTRPVIEPIVEATQKIGHTLGFSPLPTQASFEEKIGVAPVAGSAILPALGLVAGGAALGLGAAAMGHYLQPEGMRLMPGNNIFVIMDETPGKDRKRPKRSLDFDEHYLQQLSAIIEDNHLNELRSSQIWDDTPCSKRVTCEVLRRQNPDEIIVMEKKMGSLFFSSQSDVLRGISYHLQEVLDAAKNGECNKFTCTRQLPVLLS